MLRYWLKVVTVGWRVVLRVTDPRSAEGIRLTHF
jgi:hypothetical protein